MPQPVSKVDEKRRGEVRRIFQKLYSRGTANDVLAFHEWLRENSPNLLHDSEGSNSYQLLKANLGDLIRTAKPAVVAKTKRKS